MVVFFFSSWQGNSDLVSSISQFIMSLAQQEQGVDLPCCKGRVKDGNGICTTASGYFMNAGRER